MGTWGTGPFDSDLAADIVDELERCSPEQIIEVLQKALQRVADSRFTAPSVPSELRSRVSPAVTASRSRSRWRAKPVRPGSWLAVDGVDSGGKRSAEAAGEHLAEVTDMPGGGIQSGAAGQDDLQGSTVLLAQGRGMAGEPAGHLPHRRRRGRRVRRGSAQSGDIGTPTDVPGGACRGPGGWAVVGPRGECPASARLAHTAARY